MDNKDQKVLPPKNNDQKQKTRHMELIEPDGRQCFLIPDEEALEIIDRALVILEEALLSDAGDGGPKVTKSGWPGAKDDLHRKVWKFSLYHFTQFGPLDRNRP